MDDRNLGFVLWICGGVLLLLFGLSMTGNGTWMGGIGMGWMMAIPVLVVVLALYFAYKYGRMSERVQRLDKEPKTR